MGAVELIGIAASLSLLAGWRLYAVVLAVGVAVRMAGADLPPALGGLAVLGHGAVLGIAGLGALAEFLADKVALVDSLWDTVHTLVRPVGGALIATAVIAPSDPAWAVVAALAGGGASLAAHAAKAGARAAINTSPEPLSNIVASLAEDGMTAGALWVLAAHPEWAAALAAALAVLAALLAWLAVRLLGSIRRLWRQRQRKS